jgi:hypothetical protein
MIPKNNRCGFKGHEKVWKKSKKNAFRFRQVPDFKENLEILNLEHNSQSEISQRVTFLFF